MVFLFTVISVSVDAYAAGLAYNLGKRLTFSETVYAGFYTFVACLLAAALRDAALNGVAALSAIGGILLMLLGVNCIAGQLSESFLSHAYGYAKNPFSANCVCGEKRDSGVTALGISVSVDAAAATVAMRGTGAFECAFMMFVFHTFFLRIGALSAKPLKLFGGVTYFSGAFLILLGIYRIIA